MKISVIIPVYNAEKYLRKCIDSVLAQTYTNLEILLVDDCSTDGSLKICKEYAKTDSRVKVIPREINGGIYAARNEGLKNASGEYVTFVDNDDWLDNVMYAKLVEAQKRNDADFISCGFKEIIDGKEVVYTHKVDGLYTKHDIYNRLIFQLIGEQRISCAVWKTLFRKSIIDDKALQFRESRVKDDYYFVIEYLLNCNKAEYISGDYYNYWIRNSSTIHVLGLNNIEDSWKTPLVLDSIINRYLAKPWPISFNDALGREFITSIIRLASTCDIAEFTELTQRNEYRSTMSISFATCLPLKEKVMYYLVKGGFPAIIYRYIHRRF